MRLNSEICLSDLWIQLTCWLAYLISLLWLEFHILYMDIKYVFDPCWNYYAFKLLMSAVLKVSKGAVAGILLIVSLSPFPNNQAILYPLQCDIREFPVSLNLWKVVIYIMLLGSLIRLTKTSLRPEATRGQKFAAKSCGRC